MAETRTQKSARNITYGLLFQAVTILSNFTMKTVFIKFMGVQYTGISSLFTDILAALSIVELGFATAISYALYRPLHEKDSLHISKIMFLFRRIYRIVFAVVLAAGGLAIPVLDRVVKDVPDIQENIHVVFVFFLMKTAMSYLFSYKAILLEADQKKFVVSRICIVSCLITMALEVSVIVFTGNYMLYLAVMVVTVLVRNLVVSAVANKHYPFLKQYGGETLSPEEKERIYRHVKALSVYKVSGGLLKNVDSTIISVMLSTTAVGFLSCYRMIVNSVDALFGQVFEAITPSVGNLAVSEDPDRQYEVFSAAFFLSFVLGNFICTSLVTLLNPFITLWLGEEYLLGMEIVVILAVDTYLSTLLRGCEGFRNGNALFVEGKYRPAVMVAINILLSVLLAKELGIFGVLLATVISRLCTHVWYDPWLIYRRVFKRPFGGYLARLLLYGAVAALNCTAACYVSAAQFTGRPIWDFLLKVLYCLIVPNGIVMIGFFRCREMKRLLALGKRLGRRLVQRTGGRVHENL